ncbi:BspA family leucine-rich repeat surface protein [Campylobacter devanensis]|uniref:BspA family leucine-rich repeat surface protein n=1 Tax=Campylobacter devanensis TaxID=3161138 RepID=UPI000A330254|nr:MULTISPECIES: BspA family leucine-rich repeat surface protein [unclassified Campylobacter]
MIKNYFPHNRYELLELVKNKSIYLGDIDTSAITDMSNLFLRAKRKNFSCIEYWDTSNVITMEGMFARCKHFNIPIGC